MSHNPLSYATLIEPNVDACDESDDVVSSSAANDTEFPDTCPHCAAPPLVDCACYDFADDEGDSIESLGLRGVVSAR